MQGSGRMPCAGKVPCRLSTSHPLRKWRRWGSRQASSVFRYVLAIRAEIIGCDGAWDTMDQRGCVMSLLWLRNDSQHAEGYFPWWTESEPPAYGKREFPAPPASTVAEITFTASANVTNYRSIPAFQRVGLWKPQRGSTDCHDEE